MLDCNLDYDYDPTPEDSGYIHQDDLPNLDRVRDFIEGVKECLYKSGDVGMMESHLDEICHELGMKLNAGDPVIEKRGQRNMMTWYLGYQRAQIDQINWGRSCSARP